MRTNMQEISGIAAGAQIPGARDYQEDAFRLVPFRMDESGMPDKVLLVLADGMGGCVGGARASELAVSKFADHFAQAQGDMGQRMRKSLDTVNAAISNAVAQDPEYAGMGCTLLACLIEDNVLSWLSVGDSPLWLLRENEITRINDDHSMRPVLQGFVDTGQLSAEDLENDMRINQLRSAVIGDEPPIVDQNSKTLLPNDRVILASDGLETLTMDEICAICSAHRSPAATASALLNAVDNEQRDGQDNATVVLFNNSGISPQTALSDGDATPHRPKAKKTLFGKLFPWSRASDPK